MSTLLAGPQRKQLREILLAAFTRRSLIRALAESVPARDFESLVTDAPFQDQVFELIQVAEHEGWTSQLTTILEQERPGRPELIARIKTITQGTTDAHPLPTQTPESPPLQMARNFDVFLSHNSKDKPTVRQLAENLKQRGLTVWLDEWELVPGRPWQEVLEETIETVKSAAVLIGKDGIGPWHEREMRSCLSEFVDRGLPVIPVLLPGTSRRPDLPLFLRQFTWVDLRSGLSDEGLDRLQWGITGAKPSPS